MVSNIKEGDTAYWKHTRCFGIVTRVAICLGDEPIHVDVVWSDVMSNASMTYGIGDLAKDGELVIGKLTKLFYAKV
jgi:hypothetical protein